MFDPSHNKRNFAQSITWALANFTLAINDVHRIVTLHDRRRRGFSRDSRELDTYRRAALILAITAWEAFIEDTVQEALEGRLEAAPTPAEIERTFNAVAASW